jgi:hypothetical protein
MDTRSIRAVWTREMSFELNSFHGIDEIVSKLKTDKKVSK